MKKITIKPIGENQYELYDGNMRLYNACSSYDYALLEAEKFELALSKVPNGANYFWRYDPRLKEYTGKLLGGWLCDSKVEVFGIYNDGLTGYAVCLFWELSIEDIQAMIDYKKVENNG